MFDPTIGRVSLSAKTATPKLPVGVWDIAGNPMELWHLPPFWFKTCLLRMVAGVLTRTLIVISLLCGTRIQMDVCNLRINPLPPEFTSW